MSATLRFSERPDEALFSSSVGTTVITNSTMVNDVDFTLVASTYTFTVTVNGATVWTQAGVVIADGHVYEIPPIGDDDSGASAGVVSLIV
jgi:hypothetical protein